MSKTPLRNYNLFWLGGDDTPDAEVVESLGLDPQVANTPDINKAAIEKMRQQNFTGYLAKGMTESQARSLANTHAEAAYASVAAAMQDQEKQFAS